VGSETICLLVVDNTCAFLLYTGVLRVYTNQPKADKHKLLSFLPWRQPGTSTSQLDQQTSRTPHAPSSPTTLFFALACFWSRQKQCIVAYFDLLIIYNA
jgi:hypothetical protein